MFPLLRSLVLTLCLSFLAPLLLLGGFLTVLEVMGFVPGLAPWIQVVQGQLIQFLLIFGNGGIWAGVLVIAATCSLVAGFFDVFNFWLYQTVRTVRNS